MTRAALILFLAGTSACANNVFYLRSPAPVDRPLPPNRAKDKDERLRQAIDNAIQEQEQKDRTP